MRICPFVDRECTVDCVAYSDERPEKCLILHRLDRTNMLLNFLDKKIERR